MAMTVAVSTHERREATQEFNVRIDRMQSAADAMCARCSSFEQVLINETALSRLERAVAELRTAFDYAKALKE